MSVTVDRALFKDRQEALELIETLGLVPRDGQMSSGDLEDRHWHKTSLKICVLSGSFETLDVASSTTHVAGAGDLITIPHRTLHAARCPEPATYVVGFESEEAMQNFRPESPNDLNEPKA